MEPLSGKAWVREEERKRAGCQWRDLVSAITCAAIIGLVGFSTYQHLQLESLDVSLRSQQTTVVAQQAQIEQMRDEISTLKQDQVGRVKREISDPHSLDDCHCRDGRDGLPGQPGRDGADGNDGRDGRDATDGSDGTDGRDGRDGTDGTDGADGADGADGRDALGLVEMYTIINQTVQHTMKVQHESRAVLETGQSAGSVYIRWGRDECPAGSERIYKGEAAGGYYNDDGGGGTYQCLSDEPELAPWTNITGYASEYTGIHGAEYQQLTQGLHNHNVPCAACLAMGRATKIMIPGQLRCPDSTWTREYQGMLMTGNHGHKGGGKTHECVDYASQPMAGGSENTNGALFYKIKADCSGDARLMNCPPYTHEQLITCVVCTK